jgi:hypothetical protein
VVVSLGTGDCSSPYASDAQIEVEGIVARIRLKRPAHHRSRRSSADQDVQSIGEAG